MSFEYEDLFRGFCVERQRYARNFFSPLRTYLKKLFNTDWLRETQSSGNIVKERGNSVEKEVMYKAF